MLEDWTLWAIALAIGTGTAILSSYLLCRARIERAIDRLRFLEREMSLTRLQEDVNEKKLTMILEAVTVLRQTTEERLRSIHEKLHEFITEGSSH
jgi:hypothetical protein